MNWRQWIGLKPTEADLARELLIAAEQAGDTGWAYDAAGSSIRKADRVIHLTNIHCEYTRSPYLGRPSLLKKYRAMIASSTQVANLWTLAQTRIYPIIRSRYERVSLEIEHRQSKKPFPPRVAQPLLSHLEMVIGYDHGPTISQVTAAEAAECGVPLDDIIHWGLTNLRGLPKPTWKPLGPSVWTLQSQGGYTESFLQIPKIYDQLPAKGTPLAMIPNRGVLLATATEEPGGLTTLLAVARKSMEGAPWPLCGDVFRIADGQVELYTPNGPEAKSLATLQRIDLASVYADQKAALDAHGEAIDDDAFIATYGLLATKDDPSTLKSWCSWAQGVRTLLPKTDLIAFVWDLNNARQTALVRWANADRIAGHYFKTTTEDPTRIRVDEFPTPDELIELQKAVN